MFKKFFLLSLFSSSFLYASSPDFSEGDEDGLPQNLTPLQMKNFLESADIGELIQKNVTARSDIAELRKTFMREELTQKLPFLKLQQFSERAKKEILTLRQQGHRDPANEATLTLLTEKAKALEITGKLTESISLDRDTIVYILADGLVAGYLEPQKTDGKIAHDCLLSMLIQTANNHLNAIDMGYQILTTSLYTYKKCTSLINADSMDATSSFETVKAQHTLVSRFHPYVKENLESIGTFADDITYKFLDTSNDRDFLRQLLRENRRARKSLQAFPTPKDRDITKIFDLDTWSTSMRDRIESSDPTQIMELYVQILDDKMKGHQQERAKKRKEVKLRRKARRESANPSQTDGASRTIPTTTPDPVAIPASLPTDNDESKGGKESSDKVDITLNHPEEDSTSDDIPSSSEEMTSPPTTDLLEEKPLHEANFTHSLTELFEYQKQVTERHLEPKTPQAKSAVTPHLSATSKELLGLLANKSQDSVTLKRLRRFTPVVQLFDELGIRRRVENNKIVSPRSPHEAFIMHTIHKEHNSHTIVNDLRKHLDAMAPRWREHA